MPDRNPTPEIVSQANKIVRGICVNRSKSAETGQQGIIGEIKSDILRYNGNKEPLFTFNLASLQM
jgi:hypothetical protein